MWKGNIRKVSSEFIFFRLVNNVLEEERNKKQKFVLEI